MKETCVKVSSLPGPILIKNIFYSYTKTNYKFILSTQYSIQHTWFSWVHKLSSRKQRHLSPTTSCTAPLRVITSMWERTVSRHVAILVTIKAASSIRSSIRSWLGKTLVCKNRRSHERRWHILLSHCCMTGCALWLSLRILLASFIQLTCSP